MLKILKPVVNEKIYEIAQETVTVAALSKIKLQWPYSIFEFGKYSYTIDLFNLESNKVFCSISDILEVKPLTICLPSAIYSTEEIRPEINYSISPDIGAHCSLDS